MPLRFLDVFAIYSVADGQQLVSLSDVPGTPAVLRGRLIPGKDAEDQGSPASEDCCAKQQTSATAFTAADTLTRTCKCAAGSQFVQTGQIQEWCFEYGKQPCIWACTAKGW